MSPPVVDVAGLRRRRAGPSRLPLLLGVGGVAGLLIATAVVALLLWAPKAGAPVAPAPAPPKDPPLTQAQPAAAQPDKPESPKRITRPEPAPTTPPADPPQTNPTPPSDPPPAVPDVPDSWKEAALADVPPDLGSRVLDKINAVRKVAGVAAVALDADASAGCAAHAAYLARNAGRIAALGLNVHAEDPALPGQSEAGRKAAVPATVAAKEPLAALDDRTALPAHRALILSPRLQMIGAGFARNDKGQWESVFDWSGADAPSADAVVYPVAGQTGVSLYFPGDESPNPVPDPKERLLPAGFPITVAFPAKARVKGVSVSLEEESGTAADLWFSSPEKPADERFTEAQHNAVGLIAKAPLRSGVRYAVQVKATVDGRDWTFAWSFLTAGPEELRRDFEDRFLARVNAARERAGLQPLALDPAASAACTAHARYLALNAGVRLDLNPRDETPDWSGFSEEGRTMAAKSIFRLHPGTPEFEVDLLMSRLGARTMLLEPSLKQISLGSAYVGAVSGAWVMESPPDVRWAESHVPILYPSDGQKDIGLLYGPEAPSAVPEEGAGKPAGFPVTARFPWHKPLENVTGRLADASGNSVACWLSTPQKTLPGALPFVACLLPREPLREGETYTATVAADFDGKPWTKTWSFTTKKIGDIDMAAVEARVLARANEVRKQAGQKPVEIDAALSHGCQLHARYLVANENRPMLSAANEDMKWPAATPEGAKAGKESVVLVAPAPADAVDGWMRTFFHRLPILDPDLHKIGFGCSQYPNETWACVLDVKSGK